MEVAPLYTVEGRPVHVDDLLHCPPALFSRAGPVVLAYRPDFGTGEAVVRCPNGAVPTVRISDLSWKPHPETLAMEQMEAAGIKNPSRRDVLIWVTARATKEASNAG